MHSVKHVFVVAWLAVLIGACASPNPVAPTSISLPTVSAPTDTSSPVAPATAPQPPISNPQSAIIDRAPCPDGGFTCITLRVPLDHFDAANTKTIDVVFAVKPATGARKGMFVTATGGPGSSGIASADSYTSAFDPRIPERFDVVFFDQRGVAASGGLQCADAAAAFYQTDTRAQTPEQEAATVAAARRFAGDCVREMDHPPILPYLGTRQAVEDLEVFRKLMGDEQIWLYGESYGTQYAQLYAAAHPDRVAGMILDGTVDLTLSATDFLVQQARAFNDVLVKTLEDCSAKEECAADMGADALFVYDSLAARLAESPLSFTFPLPSGKTAARSFTLADLETAASNYVYSESARMLLQRALAAASRDDLVPLARLLYDSLGLDEATLEAIPDPTYSDAVYYAVECSDYVYFSGTPDERARAYIRAGDNIDKSLPRFSSIFYGDLPCAFWPAGATGGAGLGRRSFGSIPTLVLGATADPATPVNNGEQVYRRLADGYLITTDGGAHVIFGRGHECPDTLVTDFILSDTLPQERETRCEGVVADDYVPLAPVDAADFADPLQAMRSADDEITYLPEYYSWDGKQSTSVGCPYGGTLKLESTDSADHFTLTGCAFSSGFGMTGAGEYVSDADRLTLDVNVAGSKAGALTYTREGDGIRVTGEYGGSAVDLSE